MFFGLFICGLFEDLIVVFRGIWFRFYIFLEIIVNNREMGRFFWKFCSSFKLVLGWGLGYESRFKGSLVTNSYLLNIKDVLGIMFFIIVFFSFCF